MNNENTGGPTTPSSYEIRVRGRMTTAYRAAFDDLTVTVSPAETVIRGTAIDQAALYGILDRIQALGLELIEIRRLPPAHEP